MTNPLIIFAMVVAPVVAVALLLLWWRSYTLALDSWAQQPAALARRRSSRTRRPSQSRAPRRSPVPRPEATPDLIKCCEKFLFCWDYWASGKSGADLQDVLRTRDVPQELRRSLARAKGLDLANAGPTTEAPAPSPNPSAGQMTPEHATPLKS